MKKEFVAVQVVVLVVFSAALGGMIVFSGVYDEVYSNIVSVTCLSCIKLQPATNIKFSFDTNNGKAHPDFVIENLSNGPVFLAYRTIVCDFCDEMDPVLEEIFEVNYTVEDPLVVKTKEFNGTSVTFIHINKDLVSDDLKNTQAIYANKGQETLVPMFTVITVNYNRGKGKVTPYYGTAYGTLKKDTYEDRKAEVTKMIDDGIRLYNEFSAGYN